MYSFFVYFVTNFKERKKRNHEGNIHPPPRDLVIVSKACREFWDQSGTKQKGQLSNVYLHFNNESSIKKKFYVPCLVQVQKEVKKFILPEHRSLLEKSGIFML